MVRTVRSGMMDDELKMRIPHSAFNKSLVLSLSNLNILQELLPSNEFSTIVINLRFQFQSN